MKVFLDKSFDKWILGAIIRDSIKHTNVSVNVSLLKLSRKNVVSLIRTLEIRLMYLKKEILIVNQNTLFWLSKSVFLRKKSFTNAKVFFTHADLSAYSKQQLWHLNQVREIIVMNSSDRDSLIRLGVQRPTISVCFGAVDASIFFPVKELQAENFIYISGDVKKRKSPEKVFEVIESNPELKFIVFGQNWGDFLNSKGFKLENCRWAGTSIKDHGFFMRHASCYLSISTLEGGPYGTIEALASGTPVVCTPTGWNTEVINDDNGCIVGFDASMDEIRTSIVKCLNMKNYTFGKNLLDARFSWAHQSASLFEFRS